MRGKSITCTFLVVLALAACSPSIPSPTTTSPTSVATDPTPTSAVSEDRYFNEEGKFSLMLPKGWQVVGPLAATGGDQTAFNSYSLGTDPETSGGPGLSRIVIADQDSLTVEAFVLGQCSTCPTAPIEEIMLGDVPARRTVIGGGGVPLDITWTFFEHNGMLIGLAIHDPETLEPLTPVLESLLLQ